jgi:hypothetical protein
MRPYVYKTTDFGETWSSLIGDGSTVRGYAHVVKEDLVRSDLLFIGTEFGLWISLDGGQQWVQYKGGEFPCVAVRDLAIHPRDNDLVIATHGRGIWIIDDITPFRALTPQTLNEDVVFIEGNPSVQSIPAGGGWYDGDASFAAPNPPDEAIITYYQKKRHIFGDLKIEVFDQDGASLGVIPGSKRRGLSRMTWSMRLKAPKVPSAATAAFAIGPRVLPGTYTVKMTKDKNVYSTKLAIVPDPRSKHTAEDREAQFNLSMKLYKLLDSMTYAVDRINGIRLALDQRASMTATDQSLARRFQDASKQIDLLRKKIVATKEGGMITGEERLREYLTELYGNVSNYDGRPSQTQVDRADALARELADVVKEADDWIAKELTGINSSLAEKKLALITPLTVEEWEKRTNRK